MFEKFYSSKFIPKNFTLGDSSHFVLVQLINISDFSIYLSARFNFAVTKSVQQNHDNARNECMFMLYVMYMQEVARSLILANWPIE
jgi:hypothetical protein